MFTLSSSFVHSLQAWYAADPAYVIRVDLVDLVLRCTHIGNLSFRVIGPCGLRTVTMSYVHNTNLSNTQYDSVTKAETVLTFVLCFNINSGWNRNFFLSLEFN